MLGQGSFGEVWLMKDVEQNGTFVAVKCLRRSNVLDIAS